MRRAAVAIAGAAAVAACSAFAGPRELCVYVAANGQVVQVNSIESVPSEYRAAARCFSEAIKPERPRSPAAPRAIRITEAGRMKGGELLPSPDAFELDGSTRRVDMSSSLGRVQLRWPRAIETLFGRTPERAVAEATRAVSRALKAGAFPPIVQRLDLEWRIVFMDEAKPDGQIPASLVSNCHPGWMVPPTDIYIVAQRVAAGCGGGRGASSGSADGALATVLIHEIGHAVEYQLLQGEFERSRMRAEGFATWFTGYATDYSPLVARGTVAADHRELARGSDKEGWSESSFRGTAHDYARASQIFSAVVERRGIRGLIDLYGAMEARKLGLIPALQEHFGWDENRLTTEVERVLR
ncbi:MAG: hypothetical protein RL417_84 [Pseudomonadota bacterium]